MVVGGGEHICNYAAIYGLLGTVLPLLNGPSDGRPPGIYGHFLCALTCFPNKWPLMGGHLRDAASKSVQKNHLLPLTGDQYMWPMFG